MRRVVLEVSVAVRSDAEWITSGVVATLAMLWNSMSAMTAARVSR